MLHDLHELKFDAVAAGFSLLISGHSHRATVATTDGVLYLNPGSAGPRRFKLPVTMTLEVDEYGIKPHIQELA